jgi:hypothetical protein
MPREDVIDPRGHGAGTEREKAKNAMGRFGIGWEGYCICPQCGEKHLTNSGFLVLISDVSIAELT